MLPDNAIAAGVKMDGAGLRGGSASAQWGARLVRALTGWLQQIISLLNHWWNQMNLLTYICSEIWRISGRSLPQSVWDFSTCPMPFILHFVKLLAPPRSGDGKLWWRGQIQATACFCIACELGMACIFKKWVKNNVLWHVNVKFKFQSP